MAPNGCAFATTTDRSAEAQARLANHTLPLLMAINLRY